MLKNGRSGLKAKAAKILLAQAKIKEAFKDSKDVITTSKHTSMIYSMTSNTVNGIALAGVMLKQSKWTCALLQRPAGLHLAITYATCDNYDHFIKSMKKGIEAMKIDPSLNTNHETAVYGLTGSIPDKGLLNEFVYLH